MDKYPDSFHLTEEIARLKKANEELVRRNERWGRIFDAISDLIMVVDEQHRVIRLNKAMADAVGIAEQEALGRHCFELFHGSKAPPSFCPHVQLLADGRVHSEEVFVSRLGKTFEVTVFPLFVEDGRILRSVHVARDISDKKRSEVKIRQQADFLDSILNSLTHPFYVVDANDHTILVANQTALLGDIGIGQKCYAATHGRDNPCSGPEHPCPVIEVKKTGKPVTVEHVHVRDDGSSRHVEIHAYPITNAEGEVTQVIEYALDITDRKRAEEALERRIIALTRPLNETAGIAFEDLFNIDEIQKLQDQFAKAVGVGSLITRPDGTPITKPSNWCRFCSEIVRQTQKGMINCHHSDSMIGRYNPEGPTIQPCLSAGLCNAGSSISVDGRHIANWLIGQVRNETQDPDAIRAYARTIGAEEQAFMEAYHEVPFMTQEQFGYVAQALHTLAAQLSTAAYQNVQQARFISELKRTEEALKESEERLRLFIEHAPTALAMFDSEMRYLAVSRRWRKDYSLLDRDIIGRSHYEIFPRTPDGWKEVHRRGLGGEVVRADEHRIQRRDGTAQWLRWEVRPWYASEGSIGGIVIFIEDITERKRAEEARIRSEKKYKSLFDESRDGVYAVLREGEITDANPSFCEIFGYKKEEFIGKNIRELYVDPAGRPIVQKEIEEKGFVKDYEIRFRKKDGTVVDCLLTASVQYGDDGSIVGYRGIMRDLTIRKQLQTQLFQAQKMEAIGTLAGGIAHDFNNMLQIILSSTDLLLMFKDKDSPDLRNLETIRRTAKDARSLVKRLLAFSRRDQGNPQPIDLRQQLRRFQKTAPRIIPKVIDIEIMADDDLKTVNADPTQLNQLLINLMINARDAMPHGGKLTVEARNVTLDEDYCSTNLEAKPGEYALLKISDTGHGMEKDVLDHIFEPFYTTKGAGEGTGLGLSVVYGIVKNYNGHITCASKKGQGTTFSVYLPVRMEESALDAATTAGEMIAFGTETILIVDDEESIRKVVEEILICNGYNVLTAQDGNKALQIYRQKKDEIDLVILDLNMPEMGGAEVFDAILKIDPRARVLIASGYSTDKSTKELLADAASGFIAKPFDARELLKAIRRILNEAGLPVGKPGPDSLGRSKSKRSVGSSEPFPSERSQTCEAADIDEFPWRLRILAIDDREPYLKVLEAGFAQFKQTTLTALSGVEGLKIFQETAVDVVVCDLGMPELDGWEVGRRIKEICRERQIPKAPFVLLTGETDMEKQNQEATERMDLCGVDAIVGKPVDIPDLLKVMKRLIGKS